MEKNFEQKKNEWDIQFAILQATAILLVVVGHKIGSINIMSDWILIYSYHVPLWFFISGYFYKPSNSFQIKKYIIKKVKNLLLPYFVVNFMYGVISTVFRNLGIIKYGKQMNFRMLFTEPWISGGQFGLNVAGWFIPALFLCEVVYAVLRKYLKMIKSEYTFLLFFLCIGLLGAKSAYMGYRIAWELTINRLFYCLFFYSLGYFYKCKVKDMIKIHSLSLFLMVFGAQYIIVNVLKIDTYIEVWDLFLNNFESIPIVAIITPLPGIVFWCRAAKILVPSFQNSEVIKVISKNTWSILLHHQFVFFLINISILAVQKCTGHFGDFSIEEFQTNAWYGYSWRETSNSLIIYVILGMAVPIIVKMMLEKQEKNHEKIKYIKRLF